MVTDHQTPKVIRENMLLEPTYWEGFRLKI